MMENQVSSPLLTLPPELRNTIFELVLQGTTTEPEIKGDDLQSGEPFPLPPLLRSCKQIYLEASLIFYERTTFYLNGSLKAFQWLEVIRARYLTAITEVGIDTARYMVEWKRDYEAWTGKDEQGRLDQITELLTGRGIELPAGVFKVSINTEHDGMVWTADPEKDAPNMVAKTVRRRRHVLGRRRKDSWASISNA